MTYYFTFGFGQHQGVERRSLNSHYTTIEADDMETARGIMFERRANKWANVYESAKEAGVGRYNLKYIALEDVQPQIGFTR